MKILVVSATLFELVPFLECIKQPKDAKRFVHNDHEIELLITGVGITATAYAMGQKLAIGNYDLALNIGLGGVFDRSLSLGQVVNVVSDFNAEEGAEDGENFIPISDLSLRDKNEFPFKDGLLKAIYPTRIKDFLVYSEVNGITVNKVHGKESSILEVQSMFNPQIESMEGAAFFYSCLSSKLACIQLRAVSNYVERRDRDKWEVELALNNLAQEIAVFLEKI